MRLPESPLAATHRRLAATTARTKRTRPRFMWASARPVGGDGPRSGGRSPALHGPGGDQPAEPKPLADGGRSLSEQFGRSLVIDEAARESLGGHPQEAGSHDREDEEDAAPFHVGVSPSGGWRWP